jgi:hypothetical protein
MICTDCEKECDKFPRITECKTCGDSCKACAEEGCCLVPTIGEGCVVILMSVVKRDDRAHSFSGSGNSNLGCAYQEAEVSEPPPRRVRRALTAALFCGAKEGHVWRKAKSYWDAWNGRSLADGDCQRAGRSPTPVQRGLCKGMSSSVPGYWAQRNCPPGK